MNKRFRINSYEEKRQNKKSNKNDRAKPFEQKQQNKKIEQNYSNKGFSKQILSKCILKQILVNIAYINHFFFSVESRKSHLEFQKMQPIIQN
jgi:hypothetical protein